jgi:hypothetical protein
MPSVMTGASNIPEAVAGLTSGASPGDRDLHAKSVLDHTQGKAHACAHTCTHTYTYPG